MSWNRERIRDVILHAQQNMAPEELAERLAGLMDAEGMNYMQVIVQLSTRREVADEG